MALGFPSVGKSTLMSELTGTHSEVAAYECIFFDITFSDVLVTTLTTVPGVLQYRGAKIQVSGFSFDSTDSLDPGFAWYH